jgi:hypothetical protein
LGYYQNTEPEIPNVKIPNVQNTENLKYRMFKIPKIQNTEFSKYRMFKIPKIRNTECSKYRMFKIPKNLHSCPVYDCTHPCSRVWPALLVDLTSQVCHRLAWLIDLLGWLVRKGPT